MSSKPLPSLHFVPFYALFRREVKRFFKVFFQTIASPLIGTILYMLIFGANLGQNIKTLPGTPYIAFLLPGLVMMSTLRNAFENSSGSVITSRFAGEFEDLKMSPLSNVQIAWAYSLGALVRGLIVGIITFMIGMLFEKLVSSSNHTAIDHYFAFIFFLCVGGLAMGKLGLLITIIARNIEHVAAFSTFILLPLIYLGGVFFSVEQLPPFWQQVSELNPLLYLVNGMRYAILGKADFSIEKMCLVSLAFLLCTHLCLLIGLRYGSFKRW